MNTFPKRILIFFFAALTTLVYPQPYSTTEGELIFSMADVVRRGKQEASIPRFSAFFHFAVYAHFDFVRHLGFFTGAGIRNIGLITREDTQRIKRRVYSFGIPVALKFGELRENCFFLAGVEGELPLHYKEKIFSGNNKARYGEWFSDKVNVILPSVFMGIQFPKETIIRIRYYWTDFFNKQTYGRDYNRSRLFGVSLSKSVRSKNERRGVLKSREFAGL